MHGDHFLDVPYLRDKWGTQVWTLKDVAEVCEHPERYDYAAMIPAYQAGFDSLPIDRAFERGERFEWEGYTFTVDWMPGQTEFGCCIHGHDRRQARRLHGRQPLRRLLGPAAEWSRGRRRPQQRHFRGRLPLRGRVPAEAPAGPDRGGTLLGHGPAAADGRAFRRVGPRDSRRVPEPQRRGGLPVHVRPVLGPGRAVPGVCQGRPNGRSDPARPQFPVAAAEASHPGAGSTWDHVEPARAGRLGGAAAQAARFPVESEHGRPA